MVSSNYSQASVPIRLILQLIFFFFLNVNNFKGYDAALLKLYSLITFKQIYGFGYSLSHSPTHISLCSRLCRPREPCAVDHETAGECDGPVERFGQLSVRRLF